jgi:light-regulated signal transduction histidine kinase (bacteriophytochrome)
VPGIHERGVLVSDAHAERIFRDAEQELQVFSYIVSHDLSASFRQVSEFSRLLLLEMGDDLTGRQRSHADHIRAATDRCQAMMEQLLAFSRIQQKPLSLVRQDPTPLLQVAISRLSSEIQLSHARISFAPLGEVHADTGLLEQAFGHLLDNAIKFRRSGVRPRIKVEAETHENVWRVRIRDNGVGVEPTYRERAFKMFHRLGGEEAYPGIGAGLIISRRIARKHGGDVRFLDCAQGACVEFTLPCPEVLH